MRTVWHLTLKRAGIPYFQCRCGLRFPLEAGQCLSVLGHFIWQKLQRNESMKSRVLGLVHHTHPAASDFFKYAVVRDSLADERLDLRHGQNLRMHSHPLMAHQTRERLPFA